MFSMSLRKEKVSRNTRRVEDVFQGKSSVGSAGVFMVARYGTPPANTAGQFGSVMVFDFK